MHIKKKTFVEQEVCVLPFWHRVDLAPEEHCQSVGQLQDNQMLYFLRNWIMSQICNCEKALISSTFVWVTFGVSLRIVNNSLTVGHADTMFKI
jgi:hypothetical protein